MLYIRINRYTIQKLEGAIKKHNLEHRGSIHNYTDILHHALDEYLTGD